MKSLLATHPQIDIHDAWGMGEQGNHMCAGSGLPWAKSQKHLQSNSDIIYVWGRKMSCACFMAPRECSIPSPHLSLQSKGALAWAEDNVLACQLKGRRAPQTRNYAAALPLRMSHCLCLHRGAQKTCLFKKPFFLLVNIPGSPPALPDNMHSDGDCRSLPHAVPQAAALPFAKELFSPECHGSNLRGLWWREVHAVYVFRHI